MPETAPHVWADLTPDFIASARDTASQFTLADFGERLYLAELQLIPADSQAHLRMHQFSAGERTWQRISEHTLPVRQTATAQPAEPGRPALPDMSASILTDPESGAPLLRIDITGGGITATLVSTDGNDFTLDLADGSNDAPFVSLLHIRTFGTDLCATGHLAAPTPDETPGAGPALFRAADPRAARWTRLPLDPQPGPDTNGVCAFAAFGDQRFLALGSPTRGFQVWRAESPAAALTVWKPVLTAGAWKHSLNAHVFSMCAFNGGLYIASGLTQPQQELVSNIHRRGFELLRLEAGNNWDLIIGTPVYTPAGLRIPLSAQGPGIDDSSSREVQAMAVHRGALYLASEGINGFKLWRSTDGEAWQSVETPELAGFRQTRVVSLIPAALGLARLVCAITPEGHTVHRVHAML